MWLLYNLLREEKTPQLIGVCRALTKKHLYTRMLQFYLAIILHVKLSTRKISLTNMMAALVRQLFRSDS